MKFESGLTRVAGFSKCQSKIPAFLKGGRAEIVGSAMAPCIRVRNFECERPQNTGKGLRVQALKRTLSAVTF